MSKQSEELCPTISWLVLTSDSQAALANLSSAEFHGLILEREFTIEQVETGLPLWALRLLETQPIDEV